MTLCNWVVPGKHSGLTFGGRNAQDNFLRRHRKVPVGGGHVTLVQGIALRYLEHKICVKCKSNFCSKKKTKCQ